MLNFKALLLTKIMVKLDQMFMNFPI